MPENPYDPPHVATTSDSPTIDHSPLIVRVVVALQLLWTALIGAMAREVIPGVPFLEAFVVLFLFGSPLLALTLGGYLSRGKFAVLVGIELALLALQLLALLPAVQ